MDHTNSGQPAILSLPDPGLRLLFCQPSSQPEEAWSLELAYDELTAFNIHSLSLQHACCPTTSTDPARALPGGCAGTVPGGGAGEPGSWLSPPPGLAFGGGLSDRDVQGVAEFVRGLAVHHIIPNLETRIRALNHQVRCPDVRGPAEARVGQGLPRRRITRCILGWLGFHAHH